MARAAVYVGAMDGHPDHRTWARLEALSRDDKWYLGSGDGLLWAPSSPRWLHRPAFWDEARIYHVPVAPCFTVSLVTGDGKEDPLERQDTHWRPDRMRVRWRSRSGLSFTETRYLLPGGRLCSAWRTDEDLGWPNPVFQHRFLAAHTALPTESAESVRRVDTGVAWRRRVWTEDGTDSLTLDQALDVHLFPPRGHHAVASEVRIRLQESLRSAWVGAARCESGGGPEWNLTPFAEGFAVRHGDGRPPWPGVPVEGGRGSVHLAVVLPLLDLPARYAVGFVLRIVPRVSAGEAPGGEGEAASGRADGGGTFRSGSVAEESEREGDASFAGEGAGAAPGAPERPRLLPRPALARDRWGEALACYPRFRCSDEHLSATVDYRVFGLHLNRLAGGRRYLPYPAVAEGPGPLHHPTAGSAPCHMMETRWSTDPSVARGTLLNFLAHQRRDGSFPTRLYVHRPPDEASCHMNWGDAVRAVDRLHPQRAFLERAYGALSRYGSWVARSRDPEESGLITLSRPQEASQDHTPRWEAASGPELKAVDASVCACRLWRALAEMADALGHDDEVEPWLRLHRRSADALDRLWDDESGIYGDLDPAAGRLTGVKASAGFHPLLTDLPDPDRVRRLLAHLEPGGVFATPFPVPTLATDDPGFDGEGFWKGTRRDRPFNGRIWPTATCQLLEGLLRQWHRGIAEAGTVAARLLPAFVRMMHEPEETGDRPRPNSYEHYNPLTGHPSRYRGLDDHQRSWIMDLVIRGVAGVEPRSHGLRVHPLPLGLERVELEAELRGRTVRVELRGEEVSTEVDGLAHRSTVGTPLAIPW